MLGLIQVNFDVDILILGTSFWGTQIKKDESTYEVESQAMFIFFHSKQAILWLKSSIEWWSLIKPLNPHYLPQTKGEK